MADQQPKDRQAHVSVSACPSTATGPVLAQPQLEQTPSGAKPLASMSADEVIRDVDCFVEANDLVEHRALFHQAAALARVHNKPGGFDAVEGLSTADKDVLLFEEQHKWASVPRMLYFLCAVCAGCAVVQGMDQTIINGAQVSSPHARERGGGGVEWCVCVCV